MTRRRATLVVTAAWFALQAPGPWWNPAFEILYVEPIRTIELRPPASTRRIRCESQSGWIEVGVPDLLERIDAAIEARRAAGREPVSLKARRAEIATLGGATMPTQTCPYLTPFLADLLESGRAVLFDASTARYLGQVRVSVVAWDDHDTRGCQSSGQSRIFTRRSGHYIPGPDMQSCGPDCVFESVDQQMHVTSVI